MPRIDLTVPFIGKDDAKRLGARRDGERKVWYVSDGVDAGIFGQCLPVSLPCPPVFEAKALNRHGNGFNPTRQYGV